MVRVPVLRRDNNKNTSVTNTNNMNNEKTYHSKESAERRARARAAALAKWEELRRQELAKGIVPTDMASSSAPELDEGASPTARPPLRVCAPRMFPDSSDPKAVVMRSNAQVHAMAEYCSADASSALPWAQAYYSSAAGRVA